MQADAAAVDLAKGAAVYTAQLLPFYDLIVHGLSNAWAWRCPTRDLLQLYDRNVSGVHMDVGVGSGYFLDRCRFPVSRPDVTLLDLNSKALAYTSQRIRRYEPKVQRGNVLAPLALGSRRFQSIAMMYLLHCVPGTMHSKSSVFEQLGRHLASDGVLFGATVLGQGAPHGPFAKALLALYNARGIFFNRADSAAALEAALERSFAQHSLRVQGCVALFEARKFRQPA